MALTAKQRTLVRELREISSLVGMDHWNIEKYDVEARTTMLEIMRNKLVRADIVIRYTLLDEFLTVIICHYYFKKPKRTPTFKQLWRTKKFQIFNHQIMDEMPLLPKMRLVHAISEIPREVREIIERINILRNDVTHSFFPENRKAHKPKRARLYQGADIFSKAGVEKFLADYFKASEYLEARAFG